MFGMRVERDHFHLQMKGTFSKMRQAMPTAFSEIGRTIILNAFATKRELGSLEHDASSNICPCAYCMQDRQRYSGLQSSPLLLASLSGIL